MPHDSYSPSFFSMAFFHTFDEITLPLRPLTDLSQIHRYSLSEIEKTLSLCIFAIYSKVVPQFKIKLNNIKKFNNTKQKITKQQKNKKYISHEAVRWIPKLIVIAYAKMFITQN